MEIIPIENQAEFTDLKAFMDTNNLSIKKVDRERSFFVITLSNDQKFRMPQMAQKWINSKQSEKAKYNPLIYGKDPTTNIVSMGIKDDNVYIYKEVNGKLEIETRPADYWILTDSAPKRGVFSKLTGNNYYKYLATFTNFSQYYAARQQAFQQQIDAYSLSNKEESYMMLHGLTYFKGMKVQDVSVLSFDIEATTLDPKRKDAQTLLISNTFRKNGQITRKLFSIDEFPSERQMIKSWCDWVLKVDPSILVGHNQYSYDLDYLMKRGDGLYLGRDGSAMAVARKPSQFRKDGSQSYEYFKKWIHGRELVDTFFLAMKYDIGRNYPSYGLKAIIEHEGLVAEGRQFYDASKIKDNWNDPVEREKIKRYCEFDADDALKLFDLMIPSFFYLTQHIPKPFQLINESASGSQINSFMVRSYLQLEHSIPKATEAEPFEGAISYGNSGIYSHVRKVDVASLYPSIMREYHIYDEKKDPFKHFLETVEYFTIERLKNKKQAKETNDIYYKGLEQSQKIIINSMYGFMGANGLHFNSPKNAALVTEKGREILTKGIQWVETHVDGLQVVNVDTDSFSYCRKDGQRIDDELFKKHLDEVNGMFPEKIRWEDDGEYTKFIVVKAKNYITVNTNGKIKYKGSCLVDAKKEKALVKLLQELISVLVQDEPQTKLVEIYNKYVKMSQNVTDIKDWLTKKTITSAVFNSERTNETKVLDAIKGESMQEGDKIWVFYDKDDNLVLDKHWKQGLENKGRLLKRVHDTVKILENVIDINIFPKYALKKNKVLFEQLIGGTVHGNNSIQTE